MWSAIEIYTLHISIHLTCIKPFTYSHPTHMHISITKKQQQQQHIVTPRSSASMMQIPVCVICTEALFAATGAEQTCATSCPCGHVYHYACIARWTETTSAACPQCRGRDVSRAKLKQLKFTLVFNSDNKSNITHPEQRLLPVSLPFVDLDSTMCSSSTLPKSSSSCALSIINEQATRDEREANWWRREQAMLAHIDKLHAELASKQRQAAEFETRVRESKARINQLNKSLEYLLHPIF